MIGVVVLLGVVGGLFYATSMPVGQRPTHMNGKVTGFRLAASRGVRQPGAIVVVSLPDGTSSMLKVAIDDASPCRVGDTIAVDRYVDNLGITFFQAGAHPCS